LENFPYFVRNLNPRLYIAQIQNLFKENYQTFFYKNLHEESSSLESSMDEQLFTCKESSSSDECRCVGHVSLNEESSSSSSNESSSIDHDSSDEESSSSSDESSSADHHSFEEESSSSSDESNSVDHDSSDEESSSSSDESSSADHHSFEEESSFSPDESTSVDHDNSDEESSSSSDETCSVDHDNSDEESSSSSDETCSVDHDSFDEESSSSVESSVDEQLVIKDDPSSLSTLSSFVVVSAILGALSSVHYKNAEDQSTATESSSLDKLISEEGSVLTDEESSSEESSSSQEYSIHSKNFLTETAFQTKSSIVAEQTEKNQQPLDPVNPLAEDAQENKQEIIESHRVHTDSLNLETDDNHELTHIPYTSSSEHADTGNVKDESEEKRGLISLFDSLPSNYPVKSIITKGTEVYVSFFIQYDDEQQLVYFSDDDTIITIECHKIDGIIFANDVDYESYD
jgi:hypothetical protein